MLYVCWPSSGGLMHEIKSLMFESTVTLSLNFFVNRHIKRRTEKIKHRMERILNFNKNITNRTKFDLTKTLIESAEILYSHAPWIQLI